MTPQLIAIKGKDIVEKVRYCRSFNEIANTNIQAVFELILRAARTYRVRREEMPSTLYIISDMEFDYCAKDASLTNFEYAKNLYRRYGYQLPKVVFWNVNSRTGTIPMNQNELGCALVSGFSPSIADMVMSTKLDPYDILLDKLNSPRYDLDKNLDRMWTKN